MTKRDDIKKILLIGAGASKIGGAGELSYMAEDAAARLSELGYETVILNPDSQLVNEIPHSRLYQEPLDIETLEKIIDTERPDCVLPIFGGKIAMTLCHELAVSGILSKYDIKQPGVSMYATECSEDAVKFKNIMDSLAIQTNAGTIVHSLSEAEAAAEKYNYHVVIRAPYSTYSNTNSLVFNKEELKRFIEPVLNSSLSGAALISEALINRNEFEFEVMRDSKNNVITLASIENINPLDVHSGDSAIVSPVVTLTEKEYKKMEDAAYRIVEAMQIVGFADIRFSKNPETGRWVVIKVTPYVTKITSFASDVKGIDIAKIATDIIFGASLSEIPYKDGTMLDYCENRSYSAVRTPVFPFSSFPDAVDILDTKMRSVGSAVGIGENFSEALQKSLRASGIYGLGHPEKVTKEELLTRLITPSSLDLKYIYEALRRSASIEEISKITCINEYFIKEIHELLLTENRLLKYRGRLPSEPVLMKAKKCGFSNKYIADILSISKRDILELLGDIEPQKAAIKISDTAYSLTYNNAAQAEKLGGKTALIIGAGPTKIGCMGEARYAAVLASHSLKAHGYKTIYMNPEKIADNLFDRTYCEPITIEDVIEVCKIEKPDVIITDFAGANAGYITKALEDNGFSVSGANADIYNILADKARFRALAEKIGVAAPRTELSHDLDEALAIAENIGYPVLLSYNGTNKTVYSSGEMLMFIERLELNEENPIRIENFLYNAIEYEIDAVCAKGETFIPEIIEHIESAGINSEDAAGVIPPRSLSSEEFESICTYSKKLAAELEISGLINIRFAIDHGKIYLLGASVGASSTLPFVSKICKTDMVDFAITAILDNTLPEKAIPFPDHFGIREVVCPWDIFDECDPILGPEMHATGSVISVDDTFGKAFSKAQDAAGSPLPKSGKVFINLNEHDKIYLAKLCREFIGAGFEVLTPSEHYTELKAEGIKAERIKRIREGRPNIGDALINGEVAIVVNTAADDHEIRRAAIKQSIAYMTTVSAAFAAVDGIKSI